MRTSIFLAAALILLPIAVPAAPAKSSARAPIRVKVDKAGVLRLPAATVRALGVEAGRDGLVCLQFPLSVLKKPKAPKEHEHHLREDPAPPKVWTTLRPDGSLALHDTRLIPGDERVPGPPGSTWLVRGKDGRLLLEKPR